MIDWVGFIPTAIAISLVPGANQLLGLTNAVRHGTPHALAGLAGRLVAFVIVIGLVVAGLGAVLAASATALEVIKWVGVVYLAWIGVSSLLQARRSQTASVTEHSVTRRGVGPIVRHEFLVALSNPKALLLFAAVLPQFTGGSGAEAGVQIAVLGVAYLIVEIVVGLGYIGVGSRIGAAGITACAQRKVDVGSGVCFLGLAGLLAAESL